MNRMIMTTRGLPALALLAVLAAAPVACSNGKDGEARPVADLPNGGGDRPAAEGAAAEEHAATGRVVLSEAAYRTAALAVAEVRAEAGGTMPGGIEVPGQVEFDPARIALVSPRAAGRLERVAVVEGDRVGAGQPVAYLLSPAFLTAQNDFVRAVGRAKLLAGSADEQGAVALAAAARRRLHLLGAGEKLVARLEAGGEPRDLLPVAAPLTGSIVEVQALAGAAVEPGTPIARVADLSVVNVTADVPERALASLHPGQRAVVRVAAYPGLRLTGRVARIRDQLDASTRTAKAVVQVPNPGRQLRPGMFATVNLEVAAPAAGPPVLTVPAPAVLADGEARYVFVEAGPRTYERRLVEVGTTLPGGLAGAAADRVVIRSGLAAGERVVTRGAFTLKSELAKASFGEEE